MELRETLLDIAAEAIRESLPDAAVQRALDGMPPCRGEMILVAVGKAAWQMAAAAERHPAARITRGYVITKYGHAQGPLPRTEIFEAGHPILDENGLRATERVLQAVSGLRTEDRVLFLLSGGGSALFEKPLVPLEELADINRQLLACGADIVEINTIRKKLSAVKDGRFALHCAPAEVYSVILSDIVGDRPDMVASGPTCPSASSAEEALEIVDRYALHLSETALALLRKEVPRTLSRVHTLVTGGVVQLTESARQACLRRGFRTKVLTDSMTMEARDAGQMLGRLVREAADTEEPLAFLVGGETVVTLTGRGLGGRNQELALAAAEEIDGLPNAAVISVGSDGTDGPTDAAGGVVDGATCGLLREQGIRIPEVLRENDAYHALQCCGALVFTGPTGTNVNDVAVALVLPREKN